MTEQSRRGILAAWRLFFDPVASPHAPKVVPAISAHACVTIVWTSALLIQTIAQIVPTAKVRRAPSRQFVSTLKYNEIPTFRDCYHLINSREDVTTTSTVRLALRNNAVQPDDLQSFHRLTTT